jgi:holo-[acyl-carrier protein] synthase
VNFVPEANFDVALQDARCIAWKNGWMIAGTGTDLIEISRVFDSIARYGERFLQRIYTPAEIHYCQRKKKNAAESFAARFAAKEAGAKALGTGIAKGVAWSEIEVTHLPGGRPTLLLHGRAAARAAAMGVTAVHLSLSHSRDMAIAVVILESGGGSLMGTVDLRVVPSAKL